VNARRVLIVGAGRRVQRTALPAFQALAGRFEVERLLARSARVLHAHGRDWRVEPLDSLRQEQLDAADIVYLAVTKDAVPKVLARLATLDRSRADLLIDTPVVRFKHYRHVERLAGWRNVWVAEDTSELPWLELVERVVASGAIGARRGVVFQQSAYAYHAVATAKRLLGSNRVRSGRRRAWSPHAGERRMRFANGTFALSIEPRDYSAGRFVLLGSEGSISDYAHKAAGNLLLEPVVADGAWTGFRLGDERSELEPDEARLLQSGDASLGLTARTDDLKTVGFLRLLKRIEAGRGAYPLEEGLDDMLVDYHLEKLGFYVANPFTSQRSALGRAVLKLLTRGGG